MTAATINISNPQHQFECRAGAEHICPQHRQNLNRLVAAIPFDQIEQLNQE